MDPRVEKVIQTIESTIHYVADDQARADLSVQRLADGVGLTRFHLQRLFKRDTGETLRDYLQGLLLDKAAARVRFTRESLVSIALSLGFGSQQAFTRAFTRRWGMPPGELRSCSVETLGAPAHALPLPLLGEHIPVRIVASGARCLWAVRYVGPYPLVPQRWQDFRVRLDAAGLSASGPFFGMIYDDPQFTPPERTRYACAIAAPDALQEPPSGWYRIEMNASRYVQFSIRCSYMEGHARLRPRVLGWLAQSGEAFGQAGAFELYRALPSGDPDQEQYMELHCSLAG